MNLRDLEYLCALDEHKHFGKAAHACFVSQPTLSGQIKKLEEELGIELIERQKKGFRFTQAGEAILLSAQKVLAETAHMQNLAKDFHDPMQGKINLGFIPTIGPYLIPKILGALKEALPHIEFILHEKKTQDIISSLEKSTIDVGILATPIEGYGFDSIVLYNEPFLLAVPKKIRMQYSKKIKAADLLQSERLFLLEEGHCFREQALSLCHRHNNNTSKTYSATSLETLRFLLNMGEGVTLVPSLTQLAWQEISEGDSLEFLNFPKPKPAREVGLLFRPHSHRRKAFEKIAQVIKTQIKPLVQQGGLEIFSPGEF